MTRSDYRLPLILGLASLLGTAACTDDGPSPSDSAVSDAGEGDAHHPLDADVEMGLDAGSPDTAESPPDSGCRLYSHPTAEGCTSELVWQDLASGPAARDHHVTFLQDRGDSATLYVTGGANESAGSITRDLWYTQLGPDGALVGWIRGPAPMVSRVGAMVAMVGPRAYVLSGKVLVGQSLVEDTSVHSVELGPDGTPLGWRDERPLPAPRFHGAAVTVGSWIFVIGGMERQPSLATDTVWRTEVAADGTLSEWTATTALPEGRSHHALFAHNGKLYVLAGVDGSGIGFNIHTFSDYLVATVDAEGAVSPWTRGDLPFAASTHSATVLGEMVVVSGGFDGAVQVLDTVRASVLGDGELGPWVALTPLPFQRAHVHQTPGWHGFLYSVAGNSGDHVPVNRVVLGAVE